MAGPSEATGSRRQQGSDAAARQLPDLPELALIRLLANLEERADRNAARELCHKFRFILNPMTKTVRVRPWGLIVCWDIELAFCTTCVTACHAEVVLKIASGC